MHTSVRSHALERLKYEWNKEMFAQDLFGLKWERGGRTKALQDFVPNFLWTYGNIDDEGEAVNILL